jgi:GntR family transcriptional regulator
MTCFANQSLGVKNNFIITLTIEQKHELLPLDGRPYGTKITSTMDSVKINAASSAPLYRQVAAEIRRAIASGEAKPGERMPLAKDLATILGVNKNTVLRAMHELRDEGLLEFRRGRGITVAGTPERGAVMAKIYELVTFARSQGYQTEEIVAMIERVSQAPL